MTDYLMILVMGCGLYRGVSTDDGEFPGRPVAGRQSLQQVLNLQLTRARGARGFEGDPVGASQGVGGHEHQPVPPQAHFQRKGT